MTLPLYEIVDTAFNWASAHDPIAKEISSESLRAAYFGGVYTTVLVKGLQAAAKPFDHVWKHIKPKHLSQDFSGTILPGLEALCIAGTVAGGVLALTQPELSQHGVYLAGTATAATTAMGLAGKDIYDKHQEKPFF